MSAFIHGAPAFWIITSGDVRAHTRVRQLAAQSDRVTRDSRPTRGSRTSAPTADNRAESSNFVVRLPNYQSGDQDHQYDNAPPGLIYPVRSRGFVGITRLEHSSVEELLHRGAGVGVGRERANGRNGGALVVTD
jgi:hypothetical protein